MSIIIKNLSKNYKNTKALKNVSLKVENGSIYGFIGKNGAGKSTLIRCLLNLIFPDSGSAIIDGLDIVKDADKIKKCIAYLPSEVGLYNSVKVIDFLKFALASSGNLDENKLLSAIEKFELPKNKKIGELSLGNRKKVTIIATLLKKASTYILDEPTSGLDPIIQERFFEMLNERKKDGATIFLSSHNLYEVEKYCDKVSIIMEGEIVKELEMKDIKLSNIHQAQYILANGEKIKENFDNVNEEIIKLSKLDVVSLNISPLSFEEQVISYYKEKGND